MSLRSRVTRPALYVTLSAMIITFLVPVHANVPDEDLLLDVKNTEISVQSISKAPSIFLQQILKNNNKQEEVLQTEDIKDIQQDVERNTIIQNIQKQEMLDIDDSLTIKRSESDLSTTTKDTQQNITQATDISLVKKYGGFKGYQQALLQEVSNDELSMLSLDKTLNKLHIQELTQKYGEIHDQYVAIIQKKDATDETYRQLLLSMKLTERAIKDTIGSLNKRSLKIRALEAQVTETMGTLDTLTPDLAQAESNLIRYTQTFYKMHHDFFAPSHDISDLKLFSKSDNIAETLASDLMVKDLTGKVDELLATVSQLKEEVVLSQEKYIQEVSDLTEQKEKLHNEKEVLHQQVENYDEFMLYVKSNKAYTDDKKSELEQEKKQLGQEKDLIKLLNKAETPEQLKLIREKLQKNIEDESTFFDFPMQEVKKVTSFFEDEGYNHLFGVDHHYALDFRIAQGDDVYAPADGYVYKVINQNSSMLNWFILLHQNNFATVYLHMQDTFVQEGEYVKRGDVIGLSGGTPGTRGAGHMTTGPHLHREVWKDAKVVDPLLYTDLSEIKSADMLQTRHEEKWEHDHEH